MNESDAEPAASSEPTAYDEVPYVSTARASTSPVRMEAIARLLGVPAAGANDAFVLEAGCGDGGNLIPLAVALPGSRFVGIDLAASAIAKARAGAVAAGVTNVRFETADLAALPESLTGFDYVVAHGVYSWVPFEAIGSITMNPPAAPRDILLRPANLVLDNGVSGDVLLPALYPNTFQSADDELKVGRATDWAGDGDDIPVGVGGRTFRVGERYVPLTEVKAITFGTAG